MRSSSDDHSVLLRVQLVAYLEIGSRVGLEKHQGREIDLEQNQKADVNRLFIQKEVFTGVPIHGRAQWLARDCSHLIFAKCGERAIWLCQH